MTLDKVQTVTGKGPLERSDGSAFPCRNIGFWPIRYEVSEGIVGVDAVG